MERILNLIERKNLCFRSFYRLCEEFIDEISAGNTERLEDFQRKRQGLINVLDQLEQEVREALAATDNIEPNAAAKTRLSQLLSEKDGLVRSILDLDLRILAHVDRIKDETIRKLQSLQTSRKTISAYKSPLGTVETAELKKALDREA
jgi:hypothetical protein